MSQNRDEQDFQRLFDIANKILQVADKDTKAAHDMINALGYTKKLIEQRLESLSERVTLTIEGAAEQTATEAAQLLQGKFERADQAAIEAAQRYTKASRRLNTKVIGLFLLFQIGLLGGVWLLVDHTIPAYEEILARRSEVQSLENQLVLLNQKGAYAEPTPCHDHQGRSRLCIRTDERTEAESFKRPGENKTYRILWGN